MAFEHNRCHALGKGSLRSLYQIFVLIAVPVEVAPNSNIGTNWVQQRQMAVCK